MNELLNLMPLLEASGIADQIESVLRRDGKYYVVAACLAVVFTGILSYLITLESKIKEYENRKRNQK